MSDDSSHRRVWGAGFHAGLKAATQDGDNNMNQAKIDRIAESLNTVGRKVYEAVPVAESWSLNQIVGEMARRGLTHDHRLIHGCVAKLIDSGLIKETSSGMYRAVAASKQRRLESVKTVVDRNPQPPKTTAEQAPEADPIDELAGIAAEAEAIAANAMELQARIESVAERLMERIESAEKKAESLKQLQALLKNIAD